MTLAYVRKAVTALLVAGLGALGAAMLDGNLTAGETTAAAGVALAAAAGVWAVPNRPAGALRPNQHGPAAGRRRA